MGKLPLIDFAKNANSKMGVPSHSCLVLFGDNGVCILCALTSVGALFL